MTNTDCKLTANAHCKLTLNIHKTLKRFKHIISCIIWTIFALYVILIVLLHLPPVQTFLGSTVATALAQKFGTEVSVGKINLGFFNRIIIDDVRMLDQKGDSMIYASRLSAKVDLLPLKDGKISVSSAQLFGLRANIYRQNAKSDMNIQFMLDSLASKDTTQHKPLDLRIGSVIIRHGSIAYNQRDIASAAGVFSPQHIGISNLSAHIALHHLTDNDIHLSIKKIAFTDKSGLQVKNLRFKVNADKHQARLSDFQLELPKSHLLLEDLIATYRTDEKGKLISETLQFEGGIKPSLITLSDVACFAPILRKWNDALYIDTHFSGTSTSARIHQLHFKTQSGSILLKANAKASDWNRKLHWLANIETLHVSDEGMEQIAANLGSKVKIPKEVLRLGNIYYKGVISGKGKSQIGTKGVLRTDAGNVEIDAHQNGKQLYAKVDTKGINLGKILDNAKLGIIAAHITAQGTKEHLVAKGEIPLFDFNNYRFCNIKLDGSYNKGLIDGLASIADPNINLQVAGKYSIPKKQYEAQLNLAHLQPTVLGVKMADNTYTLNDIRVSAKNEGADSYLDLEAPFANIHVKGQYDYGTLVQTMTNMLASKLPTLPGIGKTSNKTRNNFSIEAEIASTEILQRMLGVPLDIQQPVVIDGNISDLDRSVNLTAQLPAFSYNGSDYSGGALQMNTEGDTLKVDARIKTGAAGSTSPTLHVKAAAADNTLMASLGYNNHSKSLPIHGALNAEAQFYKNTDNVSTAHVDIKPSVIHIGEKPWKVHPADITYSKNHLEIENFEVSHGDQHVAVNGLATPNKEGSIVAQLKDVDVEYILNLVNFHSVDFSGKASGKAIVKSIFNDPDAYAKLDIKDFEFEHGPMGILHANVSFNKELSQIDINAVADEGEEHQTLIDGYVSPKRNYIDLGIEAQGTNMKFMESFCGSFMDDIQARAHGKVNLVGDLKDINLVGDLYATGKMHMKQLGTEYSFNNLHAHAIPDDILLNNDTIFDRNHNMALVSGGIHHKHLTRLSYDLTLKAHNFLGYDTHEFGDNTFYGTVYATGEVGIHGKSGETIIDIDAEPGPGSIFVYNVASPDAISDKSFIHWHDIAPELTDSLKQQQKDADDDIDFSSDMRINFLVNATPNLTLKLMMDPQSGDYITLNGNGVLRANWFNKGSFDMFGNYVVDHGVYKLTIQNVIKKDFEFMPGGTIAFGGNPYNAPLNLQAKYTVNGVPLSDLSIGRSFSSNNIRVDCLMNITGTPQSPSVDFSMDLPTVNTDAKQMIYSVINSQEEMNQQVLYLLAIGRFYAQTKNNQSSEDADQQSQTSLAMQSFLSGTISQQLNTVLSNVVKSNNWNFGANISTGDEGFNNAEYEGILSGRLLNNRLLFNGQFGYRDNANATQSFIGDFDLRYLIFPNGNLAVRMYNQTNDRYFTRNSLNTQGLGLIMKKDFNGWRDLFGIKKKKEVKKKSGSKKYGSK
ncbi:translocation/assembly module TamB domain-containing protein [Segatella copri]|uniref:translocation/assembly module TamB domain-containing protein n=1 Tax=Segatella copri TaxID=165179 RepID=UPI0034602A3D